MAMAASSIHALCFSSIFTKTPIVSHSARNNSSNPILFQSFRKTHSFLLFTFFQCKRHSFLTRIGVPKGLAYLHEEVRPQIVRRDIKASNILLDRNLNPKISDFGLAKLFPDNATHICLSLCCLYRGYPAPEYAIRAKLTRKADIYNFGVLLLEIVNGRCNTNRRLSIAEQFLIENV